MIKQVKNRITNMDVRRWTVSSKFCYDRGGVCEGCFYKEILETPCKMRESVRELVRVFGRPPEVIKTLKQNENDLLEKFRKDIENDRILFIQNEKE